MLTFGTAITLAIQRSMTDDVVQNKLMNDKEVVNEFIKYTLSKYNKLEYARRSIEIAHKLKDMLGLRVSLYNDSILLADSSDIQEDMPDLVKRIALKGETGLLRGPEYLYFAFPLEKLGAVRLSYPLSSINKIVVRTQILILTTGLLILVVFLLIANYVARKLTQPIVELNNQVKMVHDKDYIIDLEPSSKDEIGELVISFNDMSRKIHDNINQLNQMVENEKRLKELQRSFLNNVTHEFKTPLTSIIGYSDLVNQYSDDPNLLKNAAYTIKSEGERLLHMVEKLLFLSSLEHIDMAIKYEEVSVCDLVNECVDALRLKAESQNITINKNISCFDSVLGDYEKLYSMLINILDNSIKYNKPKGYIDIYVDKEDNYIRLKIEDTGIGIPSEDVDKVFEPFYRVDKNRSRKIGGSGLGLSIVKEIVHLHKGKIDIKSGKNCGTVITVFIPFLCDSAA